MIARSHFILYVDNQTVSSDFYRAVLAVEPVLEVPGMTEFCLGKDVILGLMPVAGIRRLLGDALPDPDAAAGVPRAELYLLVDDAWDCLHRALDAGARLLSPMKRRDWGHVVGYVLDPDGHVLAFAVENVESGPGSR
ncbi:MAG: VOC family protein [Bacteroidia bacterium]|nr:VOC family protein [Bacteroidia bacterium]